MFQFVKAHGLGNDIVIFDSVNEELVGKNVCFISDRKYGIGCDCVVLYNNGVVKFWNSDGSSAKLCGNACRCLIKYLAQKYDKKHVEFRVSAGIVQGELHGDQVAMTYPMQGKILAKTPNYLINVGNLHTIFFDSPINYDYDNPHQSNFMFLKKDENWFMDIYEFGAGETYACGSGAMAASIAIRDKYHTPGAITVNMKGGSLTMEPDVMKQIGPTELVFDGKIILK